MSDHPHDKNDSDEALSFIPGSSVIDIGALRRAQNQEEPLSLDEEARSMLEDFQNDPEMQKDVLSDFDSESSNHELGRMAEAVSIQEQHDVEQMEALSLEVAQELKEMNEIFIAEDKILEDSTLRNQLLGSEDEALSDSDSVETEDMSEEDAALKAALPRTNESGEYDLTDLQSCIDTLLFYSDRPISLKKIKDMLEMADAEDAPLLSAIELLKVSYQSENRGFELTEIAGGYQLRTKLSKAPLLRKLAKVQIQRLSRGAMETLTICAYKQPCTKDDIDQVRGVDSSHFIRTLLDRKLIEISGRSEAPGRPMIYTTTDTFLEVFGLMDLGGLPPLREIEAMVPQMAASEEGGEDPRVLQMRKMVGQMKTEANHLNYDSKEDERILQDIRDRVKSIDISTPYLERQKELAAQGIVGEAAEELLAKEFGFDQAMSGGEPIATDSPSEVQLNLNEAIPEQTDELSPEELAQIAARNSSRTFESETLENSEITTE